METVFVKIEQGTYDVVEADSRALLGTVEQIEQVKGLKQWRFRLMGEVPKALHGEFVAIGNTRDAAVADGVSYSERAGRLALAAQRGPEFTVTAAELIAKLIEYGQDYQARSRSERGEFGSDTHQRLGRAQGIASILEGMGFDRKILGDLIHGFRQEWQREDVAA